MPKASDGGPAFPRPVSYDLREDAAPAFDIGEREGAQGGMTLRQWFAGKALQGILANPYIMSRMDEAAEKLDIDVASIASAGAFKYADEMIARESDS